MTILNHYLINNRTLTTQKPIHTELNLKTDRNYLFDLSYLGVIDVLGEKSIDFLQGQLTSDLNLLSDIRIVQGAQCNLKGRILALMDIINWQGIKLVLPKDLLDSTIHSLNKTAMLSRVKLNTNTELKVLGFYLQNDQDIHPDADFFSNELYTLTYGTQYSFYYLGHGFYVFLATDEWAEKITQRFAEKEQLLGSLTWHTLRLYKQQVDIYPESRGLFLPHRLDLHQTPYLSFNKGCYKGQEIIARMHYKATIKHQLKIYYIHTNEKIYSGQKLINEQNGLELGELIDYSILDNDHYLIAASILKDCDSRVLFEGHEKSLFLV